MEIVKPQTAHVFDETCPCKPCSDFEDSHWKLQTRNPAHTIANDQIVPLARYTMIQHKIIKPGDHSRLMGTAARVADMITEEISSAICEVARIAKLYMVDPQVIKAFSERVEELTWSGKPADAEMQELLPSSLAEVADRIMRSGPATLRSRPDYRKFAHGPWVPGYGELADRVINGVPPVTEAIPDDLAEYDCHLMELSGQDNPDE